PNLLIDFGPDLSGHSAAGSGQYQVARLGIHAHMVQPLKGQTNLSWIGARGNLEIVFQLTATAVEYQVDAVVYRFLLQPGVIWDVRTPLFRIVADVVVADASGGLQPIGRIPRMAAVELHSKYTHG